MHTGLDLEALRHQIDTWSVDIPGGLTRTQIMKLILAFQYRGMAVAMQVVPPEAFADLYVRARIAADCTAAYDALLAEVTEEAARG